LLPFAVSTYATLASILGEDFFIPKEVAWLFRDIEVENNWMARSADADLQDYIYPNFDKNQYQSTFGEMIGGVEFRQAGRTDLPKLIEKWKAYLIDNAYYVEEVFDYSQLKQQTASVEYKNIIAEKIVFCEGVQTMQNPYFNYLPFNPAKG